MMGEQEGDICACRDCCYFAGVISIRRLYVSPKLFL